MQHVFFAERQASRIEDVAKDTPVRELESVGVIGGGTMGGGIAMSFANAGIRVTMIEISDEALDRGLGIVERNNAGSVSRGKINEEKAATCRAPISGSTDYASLADDVLATVMALAKKIRKVAVVSGVCYGFIGNRMLNPYGTTAQLLLLEGASPQQVDSAKSLVPDSTLTQTAELPLKIHLFLT